MVKRDRKRENSRFSRGKLLGFVLLLINLLVKTYRIEAGRFVVWDEAHFGKFGSRYLKREFYFDVHPPLGKMLTALSGFLAGQDPAFSFESGTAYPDNMDYVGMRRFHAVIGSLVAVFAYGIMRELGRSPSSAFATALLFVFENGLTTVSRLILLDSHLLLFTAGVAYALARVAVRGRTLDRFLLGMLLGCVMSVKWIGCLTTALAGLPVAYELLHALLSRTPMLDVWTKLGARAFVLIAIPCALYLAFFAAHLRICDGSSSDEAHMSSLFQAGLRGSPLSNTRKYVAFGTVVSIKSVKAAGGNLHSHAATYPGTQESQITTYFHKDANNHWAFQKVVDGGEQADVLANGDEVVLLHTATRRYLAADTTAAPVSAKMMRAYGSAMLTPGCVWIVEIDHDLLGGRHRVRSITSRFRLRHRVTGQFLASTAESLPSWGFTQGEVAICKDASPGTLWNVEENKTLPGETEGQYTELGKASARFLRSVCELNIAMFNTNRSLTQDPNLEPARIVSEPIEWMLLRRGLRMNSWDGTHPKFYMFGNPVIWYCAGLCVLLAPILLLVDYLRHRRSGSPLPCKRDAFLVYLSFGGWLLHYLPFFFIGRVLYFHHYYPALFFAIFSIEYVFRRITSLQRFYVYFVAIAIIAFIHFAPFTYGIEGNPNNLRYRQWRATWDFK